MTKISNDVDPIARVVKLVSPILSIITYHFCVRGWVQFLFQVTILIYNFKLIVSILSNIISRV